MIFDAQLIPIVISGVFCQVSDRPDRAAARGVRARAALARRRAPLRARRLPRDAQGQEGKGQELQDLRAKDLRRTGEGGRGE